MDREMLESDTKWVVTLWSGEVLSIFADSRGADGENLVFDVFIPGTPPYLVEVARVPHALIDTLESEYVGRLGAPDKWSSDPHARITDPAPRRVPDAVMLRWEAEKAFESDTEWVVTFLSGEVLSVYADSTSVEGQERVFTVTAGKGLPYEIEIARMPLALIAGFTSELADRPGAPDRYPPRPRMPFAEGLPVPTRPSAPTD